MSAPALHWISASDPPQAFPIVSRALQEPNGLLAAGGDLSEARLLYAYRHGIFPWYENGQPILWWSPDPRCVLRTEDFTLSKRNLRALRHTGFRLEFNRRFRDVIEACAAPRRVEGGTWITPALRNACIDLHRSGWAHSIEVLHGERLVGGLYGLAIGRVLFGESMFSREPNASKAALLAACRLLGRHGFPLVDCQVESAHLMSLGATMIRRRDFTDLLQRHCDPLQQFHAWPDPLPIADLL